MEKVTVICLEDDRKGTVAQLRDLGIVHVVDVQPPSSGELDELLRERARIERAASLLRSARKGAAALSADAPPAPQPHELVATTLELAERLSALDDTLLGLKRAAAQLEPWGSFSRASLAQIEVAGLQLVFGQAPENKLPEPPAGAARHIVARRDKTVYFAIVAPADMTIDIAPATLPEDTDMAAIEMRQRDCTTEKADAKRRLAELATHASALDALGARLDEDIRFVRARDGMGAAERLAFLQGYVPAKFMARLLEAAGARGWAVRHEAAAADDPAVPTWITMPRFFNMAKPIFEFLGIMPAYCEADVSIGVLVFLTIFFGMIVGDAGYGAIFLAASVVAKLRLREPRRQLTINLAILLSLTTLAWGWLNGNWFAIAAVRLPVPLRGVAWLNDAATSSRHVQWLCFLIAAVHLSLGRAWQAFLNLNRRAALGHVGWGLLIWGNFFTAVELIVSRGSFPRFAVVLYALGIALVLGCGVRWKDAGDVLNLPFGFIGSFVDVLSYIRLFAVGLSSFFIAQSFNLMGSMILGLSPWLFIPAAAVIVFGHALNIALAFMGVLVHGIRLNTLEFSNHMGLTWSGKPYKPLGQAVGTLR